MRSLICNDSADTQKRCIPEGTQRFDLITESVSSVRDQRNISGALDRGGQLTLMECTGAGDSAGQNLCTLSHALLQTVDILVVDALNLIGAEHANLSARSLAAALRSLMIHRHDIFPSFSGNQFRTELLRR